MKNEPSTNEDLRRKAEERLSQSGTSLRSMPHADVQALVHELQVHQIELEMQTEELLYAKAEAEDATRIYSDLYNFAPIGYLTVDDKGAVIEANLAAGDLLGVARSELIETPFRLFVSPRNYLSFETCRNTAMQTGSRQSCEMVLLKGRKEPFHALIEMVTATKDDDGSKHNRMTITDISEIKHAEESLRRAYDELEDMVEERTRELKAANHDLLRTQEEAERRSAELESFIASIADGVALLDSHGNVTFMNDDGMDILGVPLGETFKDFTGRYKAVTLEGEPVPRKENAVLRALKGEAVADMRVKLITPWDKEVTLSVSASPVMDDKGRVMGATMVFRDVSVRVAFERERQALFEREKHIAEVLQKALVPATEYDIPGCEIAVRYQPASKEAEVGGDFYDVFLLGNGKVGIVIGDVVGKGLGAAISVAAAKHSIRSYAYIDPRPGRVMTLANEALCKDQPGEGETGILTACFAVIDTRFGGIAYASGGHEPPLLLGANGSIEQLDVRGRAMGVIGGFEYPEGGRKLRPGDVVVMVTDGITEAHPDSWSFFGIEGVEQYLSEQTNTSPSDIADGLLKAAKDHAGGALADDVAIVAVSLKDGD